VEEPNRQTCGVKILGYMRDVCENSYTVHNSFCWRLFPIHAQFIDFKKIQGAMNFEVITLEFGNAEPISV
jgi:hypothetical protein